MMELVLASRPTKRNGFIRPARASTISSNVPPPTATSAITRPASFTLKSFGRRQPTIEASTNAPAPMPAKNR